jgi:SAM-dependent methyltransferase
VLDLAPAQLPLSESDPSRPNPSRIHDYCIGGKNHFAADRAVGDAVLACWPSGRTALRENRRFLGRAVRYLAAEAGVRQFLDIGCGLPAAGDAHQVAQRLAPASRVVYVDSDPMVLVHGRALLECTPEGRVAYVQGDLRGPPEALLSAPAVRSVLDFTEPVALLLLAVLPALEEADDPAAAVSALLDALPPGSYLVASHLTAEHDADGVGGAQRAWQDAGITLRARDVDDFASLAFPGLRLVPPGVVLVSEWRPDSTAPRPGPAEVSCYGGVACKP